MKYIIITGASRGLGDAIARGLLDKETTLFCLSRKSNEKLVAKAYELDIPLYYHETDLNSLDKLEELMKSIFNKINKDKADFLGLINNAASIEPLKPIENMKTDEIKKQININLIAPMILTSLFIRYGQEIPCNKTIINVSSGAAHTPFHGWTGYCSSKAGIDMFTESVALEQQKSRYPVKIVSFSPGIIDTDMQEHIRSSKKEDFDKIEIFKSFKETGSLQAPDYVASKLLKVLFDQHIENGSLVNVKDISI